MKNVSRVYVLSVHPASKRTVRLWIGRNLHALRHCQAKEIHQVLIAMKESVDEYGPLAKTPVVGTSYSINRSR